MNANFRLALFLILMLLSAKTALSQVVYENFNNDIYRFLERQAQKGIIQYNDYVKPISRKYIAGKLSELNKSKNELSPIDLNELDRFLREYGTELKSDTNKINYENISIGFDEYNIWKPFYYQNNITAFELTPKIGYQNSSWDDESYTKMLLGINAKGTMGNSLGFNFNLLQTRQEPGSINDFFQYYFTKSTGADVQLRNSKRLEFSTIDVSMGVDWNWGSISIGKDHNTFGYERNGSIILSDKAPTFLFLRFDAKPLKWLSFNYLHTWLNSDIIDTNSYRPTWRYRGNENTDSRAYVQKYMVLHSLTFTPITGLDISIGESIIYFDKYKYEFLIPALPFGLLGASWWENKETDYNSQFFLSFSSRNHIKNTQIYGSFYADELAVSNYLEPKLETSKYAFSLGGSVTDLPINNLTLNVEYTKILPAVYRHFEPALTYTSSGFLSRYSYTLGHWANDNSEILYASLNYRIIRGLDFTIWTQQIRKGSEVIGEEGYILPVKDFLYAEKPSDRKNYLYYGFSAKYHIHYNLSVKFDYNILKIETETADKSFIDEELNSFSFTFGYAISN